MLLEPYELRHFVRRALLFICPIAVVLASLVAIDPFNYFGLPSVVSDQVKTHTSKPLNEVLWKMIDYSRHPEPNILLGDSRMNNIDLAYLNRVSPIHYYNLAYGGAAMDEVIESFWFANKTVRLKNVYISANLNLWNTYYRQGRASVYPPMQRNPFLYLTNRTVLRAAGYNLYYQTMGGDPRIGAPSLTRDEFWTWQLHQTTDFYYGHFVLSEEYQARIREIASYCSMHGINLAFVVFPTHSDLQRRLLQLNLARTDGELKNWLRERGKTFDFDYANELTDAATNFTDPYHYNVAVGHELVDEVWGGKYKFGRVSDPTSHR